MELSEVLKPRPFRFTKYRGRHDIAEDVLAQLLQLPRHKELATHGFALNKTRESTVAAMPPPSFSSFLPRNLALRREMHRVSRQCPDENANAANPHTWLDSSTSPVPSLSGFDASLCALGKSASRSRNESGCSNFICHMLNFRFNVRLNEQVYTQLPNVIRGSKMCWGNVIKRCYFYTTQQTC